MKNSLSFIISMLTIIIYSSCSITEPDKNDKTTFISNLPVSVKDNILWYCDYEDNSFVKWEDEGTETPNAGGGIFITDETNSTYGIVDSLSHSGRYSAHTSIVNAIYPTQNKAVRLMRWTDKAWDQDGTYFPNATYYSTFFLMKYSYDPAKDPNNDPNDDGGWWNIFQFKSENNDGSQPVVALDIYNESGKMYFALTVKDYPDDNSTEHTQEYILQTNPVSIKVNEWNHIEMYYEKSELYTGKVIVWQNGIKIFEKNNIRTVLPPDKTATWGIGNYTDYITGGPVQGTAIIYFDDAIISKLKISDYIF